MEDFSRRATLAGVVVGAIAGIAHGAQADENKTGSVTNVSSGNASQKRTAPKAPPAIGSTVKLDDKAMSLDELLKAPAPPQAPPVGDSTFDNDLVQLKKSLASSDMLAATLSTQHVGSNPTGRNSPHFSYEIFRCDLLVAQSLGLLSRCLQTRVEWEALYKTSYDFTSELDLFNQLDSIHQLEEANGFYDVDPSESTSGLLSASALMSNFNIASQVSSALKENMTNGFQEQFDAYQLLAWLSHISAYPTRNNADNQVTWDGKTQALIQFCQDAAVKQGQFQLANAISQITSDLFLKQGQVDALEQKIPGLSTRATWDQKNRSFRQLRTQVIRSYYANRETLVSQPDGALNFSQRLLYLQRRFDTDLDDGLSRLLSISNGFGVLFGYSPPIPVELNQVLNGAGASPPSTHLLDIALEWLRRFASWYDNFSTRDQVSSNIISLKTSVPEADWQGFQKTGMLSFDIQESMFPNQIYLRLRAVSLYVEGVSGSFSAKMVCPRQGQYRHSNGAKRILDQSSISSFRFGRIETVDSVRPPDRVGTNFAYNSSPIGMWQISVSEKSTKQKSWKDIDDVLVEYLIAGQEP